MRCTPSHPGMGYSNFRSKILTSYTSRPGTRPTVVGRIHPSVGWRGHYPKLSHKSVLAKIFGDEFKKGVEMKNQIEILKELFREVLGTISVEEFMENGELGELTTSLFSELSLNA